jgi:phospholipase/lecithinase/hemolysin
VRLVDAGNLGRQQYDEFAEWWEQFQPYGRYGDNPGPWWAAIETLWPAMTGCGDAPVLTAEISLELQARRAEVRHFKSGIPWKDP